MTGILCSDIFGAPNTKIELMKKSIVMMLSCTMLAGSMMAQSGYHRCSSNEVYQDMLQADPNFAANRIAIEAQTQKWINQNSNVTTQAVITIPVVFHVVYNTSAQNISDAKIQAQINQLNLDFSRSNADAGNTPSAFSGLAANTQIQFCLAQRDPSGNATNGIVRKSTTVSSFSTNNNVKRNANGGSDAWSASSYLNIWSCNLSGGVLGYAQFPGGSASTDGVVLLYSAIGSATNPGTASPYNLGRTATHEVGHWLNLYHIWGDDGTSCSGSDQVSDTPNQADENYGCPSFPTVSCSNGANGDMFMNYMDYTDDACMNMFSTGQATRMTAALNGTRASLQSSLGCVPPSGGGICGTPSGLASSSITTTSATISWTAVSGATSYNVQYRVVGAASWLSTTSSTSSRSLTGLTAATNYQFQVQAVCSSGSSSFSSTATFTTSSVSTCSDTNEPNETRTAGKTIATNTDIQGLISSSTDNDYFKFTTTSPNTNIQVTLTNLPADYDLRLYNSSGTTLATSQLGGTSSETIKRNTTSAGTYYLRVWGYNGANSTTQCYKLRVATSSTAFRLGAENETIGDVAKDDGFAIVPNPVKNNATVYMTIDNASIAQLKVTDLTGRVIKFNTVLMNEGVNKFDVDVAGLSNGIYIMEIKNGNSVASEKFVIEK